MSLKIVQILNKICCAELNGLIYISKINLNVGVFKTKLELFKN